MSIKCPILIAGTFLLGIQVAVCFILKCALPVTILFDAFIFNMKLHGSTKVRMIHSLVSPINRTYFFSHGPSPDSEFYSGFL